MTKKHLTKIARIIAETKAAEHPGECSKLWASGCNAACERIANQFADYAETQNPEFDRARFLKACEVWDMK